MPGETDDLYESAGPPAPKPDAAEKPEKEGDDGEKTFLVPSEICPGMKPGEEMVVTIKAVHDEQYEISYSPKKDSEEEGSKEMAQAPNPGEGGGGEESMYA